MRNEPCGRDIVIPYILYFILNFRMKRFRFCLVAGMLLFISVSTVAKGVPTSIQAAFEKMYPYVANAQWEQMAGCYVAEFVIDGRETDVWFDENAQWVIIIRKSKFPLNPERSVQISGKRTKRSVQKKAAHNTYKAGTKG